MIKVDIKDRITLDYLIKSAVNSDNGDIYDCDIDRFIGIYLTDDIRQQIKVALKEIICIQIQRK